jgi:hypothetical protein
MDDNEELDRRLEAGLGPDREEAWGLAGLEGLRMGSGDSGSGLEEGVWGSTKCLVGVREEW